MDFSGYDAELRRHNEMLRRAGGIQPHEHVLDIGCGGGQSTRQAARAASAGAALGVDVSAPAIEQARRSAAAEGLHNVTFERADAQVHRFPQSSFDVVISRFGVMFFADPAAAFANIGQALRPDGRMVLLVWQAASLNDWYAAVHDAVGVPAESGGPNAFSLAERPTVTRLLETAGFSDVTFTDVHEPVYYGQDLDAALDWIRGFAYTRDALESMDGAAAERTIERLREMLAAHAGDDGIQLDSRAWIVTARRSG